LCTANELNVVVILMLCYIPYIRLKTAEASPSI
jgi:hypothetical protein